VVDAEALGLSAVKVPLPPVAPPSVSAYTELKAEMATPERKGRTVHEVLVPRASDVDEHETVEEVGVSQTVYVTVLVNGHDSVTAPVGCPAVAVTVKLSDVPDAGLKAPIAMLPRQTSSVI